MNKTNFNDSYIGPDELIYNNDGEIHSGGFSVDSIMLKNGLSPIMTLNDTNVNVDPNTGKFQMGGEKVSDLFNNLVIPNWSLSYNYKNGASYEGGGVYGVNNKNHHRNVEENEDDVMEEDLHEKLLNLVKVDKSEMMKNNKKNTKKHFKSGDKNIKNNKNNKTKKVKRVKK
jgi:hypothetical protein